QRHQYTDDDREHGQPLADPFRHRVQALGSEVADQDQRRRPQTGAEDAEGSELPVAHPAAAGDERREGADEADEPADQDRPAAVAVEVAVDVAEPFGRDPQALAVPKEEATPQLGAEQEAGRVARERAEPGDRED